MNWRKYCNKSVATFLLTVTVLISGCAANPPANTLTHNRLKVVNKVDSSPQRAVIAKLEEQYRKWKHTPYVYGGSSKKGIDCSALMLEIYKEKFHIELPRTTTMQAKLGTRVTDFAPGDLIFFKTGRGVTGMHVGVYVKDGMFMHASSSKGVVLSKLDNSYWKSRYWMARRIIDA